MINVSDLRSCTVQRRDGGFCERPSASGMPFPICAKHAVRLYRDMAAIIAGSAGDLASLVALGFDELDDQRAERIRRALPDEAESAVVYYLMIDGLVKIGYASNLAKRLTAYPPTAQLLATEPGDRSREAQRHAEFNEYLTAGREWFTPGPRLRAHIEGLTDYRAA